MKIMLLTIATNKYVEFAKPLYESVEKHFLPGHTVNIFLFTNKVESPEVTELLNLYPTRDSVGATNRCELHVFHQEHKPWPHMTLDRYKIFQQAAPFTDYDYVFYTDIDMRFVACVGDEVLGELVGTCHPGFFNKSRSAWTYETRPESKAYIAPNEGNMYFAGGFQGGSGIQYTEAMFEIAQKVQEDQEKGITAIWHDESHWNRYLKDNPPTVILSPSYCFPESWHHLPFHKRLLALDKNHAEFRKEVEK